MGGSVLMPSVVQVRLQLRGQTLELDAPGPDAPVADRAAAQVEMLLLALLALDDSRVDGVLRAFGFRVEGPEGVLFE